MGLFLALSASQITAAEFPVLSKDEQQHIAALIFHNECHSQTDCLVAWNDGEAFASLGIGHFIWFPPRSKAPFKESFPELLRWFELQGVVLPAALTSWVRADLPCPWAAKDEFLKAENQPAIQALREFLLATRGEQASFIIHRLAHALPLMQAATDKQAEKEHMQQQFQRISAVPGGWYVLADYVNFKGEGIKESERYQGQGWGLAQVLLKMHGSSRDREAIAEFVAAAAEVLAQRVKLSPPERNEQRWLPGWNQRLRSYLLPK